VTCKEVPVAFVKVMRVEETDEVNVPEAAVRTVMVELGVVTCVEETPTVKDWSAVHVFAVEVETVEQFAQAMVIVPPLLICAPPVIGPVVAMVEEAL
jgi:hypothetical protein